MKTLVKIGVASAMALGYATANAGFVQPSSGTGDLILFVQDTTSTSANFNDTLAVDLGSVNNINSVFTPTLPSGSPGADFNPTPYVLTNSSSFSLTAAQDGMNSFLATVGSDSLQYAVMAAQYPLNSNNATNKITGNTKYLTTLGGGVPVSSVAGVTVTNLNTWGSTLNTGVTDLNSETSGSSISGKPGQSPVSSGIWNTSDFSNATGLATWSGAGPSTLGLTAGTSSELYGLTGNGGTGQAQVYDIGSILLSTAGVLTFTANTSTVPLPPAVWLLGSGLLGLAGVGRRRSAKV